MREPHAFRRIHPGGPDRYPKYRSAPKDSLQASNPLVRN
jgi:hypothetical protein